MLSCPLIEYLVLYSCVGLRTIHVNNNNNLKQFEFDLHSWTTRDCSIEIGHVPSLETIKVDGRQNWWNGCLNWFDHRKLCFAHLKSLCLTSVRLSSTIKSFDIYSSNFPSLEDLTLDNCYGFEEFKLSSLSIKHLAITKSKEPIKATIDAPNILYFKYSSRFLQSSISFTTTCSHEWGSCIHLYEFLEDIDNDDDRDGSSLWLHKINEVVKAYSQSKISLHLSQSFEDRNLKETVLLDHNSTYKNSKLVVVKQLTLVDHSSQSLAALMKCMFRIFRPRYIGKYHWLDSNDEAKRHVESLSKILVAERGRGAQFWPQDWEDAIMEESTKIYNLEAEWRPTDLPELKLVKIGLRLKWRETEMSPTTNI